MPLYPNAQEVLANAIALWKIGFAVVPIISGQKNPAGEWKKYQTERVNVEQLQLWWSGTKPTSNGLGIITGISSHDVVIDFDPTPPYTVDNLIVEAEQYFSTLLNETFVFPKTCRVCTSGKAYHDHYHCDMSIRTKKIFDGTCGHIELRGDGSIVVMPPTVSFSKRTKAEGSYSYLTPMDNRVSFEGTLLAKVYAILATNPTQNEQPLSDEPTIEQMQQTAQKYAKQISNKAKQVLLGKVPPADRSEQCYFLACELVRSGIRDRLDLATLLTGHIWHTAKYASPDRKNSEWGNWGHACKLADKVLEEIAPRQDILNESLGTKYKVINLADVPARQATFLINPYIPRGEITLLDGDSGDGKSWVWLALVAGLTGSKITPVPYDNTAPKTSKILILTTEDDLGILSLRLDLLGANKKYVTIISSNDESEEIDYRNTQGITAKELPAIKEIILDIKPDLIIIDPITLYATSDEKYDSDKGVRVRGMLNEIKTITRKIDCATLIVRHFRKQTSDRAIHRGVGSVDHAATSRSMLVLGKHPENPAIRCVAHAKCNLAAAGPSLTFTLQPNAEPPFQWLGVSSDVTADNITAEPRYSNGEDKDTALNAEEFLSEELRNGKVLTSDIYKAAKQAHIADGALKKARSVLGVRSRKYGKEWYMELPNITEEEGEC